MRFTIYVEAMALALAIAGGFLEAADSDSDTHIGVVCESIGNAWDALTDQCLCAPCHLCEYSFFNSACQLIENDDMDLSDGSDVPVTQPELLANNWFLTESEMTAARGGSKRNGLSLFTLKNNVTTFAATNEFFDSVYLDFQATKPNDHVFATGWSFDDVSLRPQQEQDANFNDTKLLAVVQQMASKQVDVHFLGWANFFESSQNVAFQSQLNGIQPLPPQGDAYFIFDDRLADATSSHHQKSIFIKRQQGIAAYVGGIDLTWDRWDTITHDASTLRQQANIERQEDSGNHGWIDGHVKIDGPGAKDVAANFLQRWNAKTTPLQDALDPLLPFENPSYSNLDDILVPHGGQQPLVVRTSGHHAVQVVRTCSCKASPHYDAFAPQGEQSIFQARLKALKMAKNYVYIEDQYFIFVQDFLDTLLEILPHLQRVVIVTQPPSSDTSKTGYKKYQYEMLAPLQAKFPHKVQIYRPKADRKLYVHSKIVVIDDVYLSIGSANWNRRGMTSDSELGANVVDTEKVHAPEGIQVTKLARDFRIRKFMELSGLEYEKLDQMTFLDAANALDQAATEDEGSSIIEKYQVEQDPSFLVFVDEIQDVVDPYEQCS